MTPAQEKEMEDAIVEVLVADGWGRSIGRLMARAIRRNRAKLHHLLTLYGRLS